MTNTEQHNLNPVECTLCASGLHGRLGQRHQTDLELSDPSRVLAWELAAMFGMLGLTAGISGFGQINLIA